MTEAEALELLTDTFLDGWELLHPDDPNDPDYCPVAAEGEDFEAQPTWVRFSVIFADEQQRSIGAPGTRKVSASGSIAVQVFVDAGQGTLARAQLCDDVRSVLRLKRLTAAGERLDIYAGPSRNPSTDGRWLTQLVVLPFEAWATA